VSPDRPGLVYFAVAIVFGNGQSRLKVAFGEVCYVKNLLSASLGAGAPASYR
jgi:hypothetical protein